MGRLLRIAKFWNHISYQISVAIIIALLAVAYSLSQNHQSNAYTIVSYALENSDIKEFDQTHEQFDSILERFVKASRVDYRGLQLSREQLQAYMRTLGEVSPDDYNKWTESEQIAYWINAYNAFTLAAIIDNYPIKRSLTLLGITAPSNSIRQIRGIWDKLQFRAMGNMVTLGEIEHEILRKKFNEPRIHAAINCASIGCPDLRDEAYTGDKLEVQLVDASKNFVNNPSKGVYVNPKTKQVKVSKIFKWFGEDFIATYGETDQFAGRSLKDKSVLSFVLTNISSEYDVQFLEKNDFKLGYLHYDWHLNEQTKKDNPSS